VGINVRPSSVIAMPSKPLERARFAGPSNGAG
jgi:hypothetical protein